MLLIFIAVRNAWRRRIWRFVILRRTLRIWYYSAWPTSSMYCLEVKVTPGYKVKSFTVDLHEVCPEAKCLYFNFLQCSCTDFLWLTAFHKSGFLHETTHQPLAMIISMTHARKGIAWIAEESKHEHKIVANKFSVASCPFVAQHQTILFRFFFIQHSATALFALKPTLAMTVFVYVWTFETIALNFMICFSALLSL